MRARPRLEKKRYEKDFRNLVHKHTSETGTISLVCVRHEARIRWNHLLTIFSEDELSIHIASTPF